MYDCPSRMLRMAGVQLTKEVPPIANKTGQRCVKSARNLFGMSLAARTHDLDIALFQEIQSPSKYLDMLSILDLFHSPA